MAHPEDAWMFIFVLVLLVALLIVVTFGYTLYLLIDNARYGGLTHTTGTVHQESSTYRNIKYEVNGKEYKSDFPMFTSVPQEPGSKIDVFYVTKKPERIFKSSTATLKLAIACVITGVVTLAMIGFIYKETRSGQGQGKKMEKVSKSEPRATSESAQSTSP